MSYENLTKKQVEFLEECNIEFADRYTVTDPDYKQTYENDIPSPPIICPWYGRARFNHRDRAGGSRYNNRNRDSNMGRDYRSENRYQEYNHRDRDRDSNERRYRPY